MSVPEKLPFLPDDHHYAIAAVATRSAQLDHMVEHAVSAFLPTGANTAELLLKRLSPELIIDLLRALLLDHYPAEAEETIKLIGAIKSARGARNKILHWLWGKSDDPETAVHATIRPYRDQETNNKTARDIQEVADSLLNCVREIDRLLNRKYEEVLSSLRQISSQPSPQPGLAFSSSAHPQDTLGLLGHPQEPFPE